VEGSGPKKLQQPLTFRKVLLPAREILRDKSKSPLLLKWVFLCCRKVEGDRENGKRN